jgi:hypothetical protein
MATRSIILVTGRDEYSIRATSTEVHHLTVRLYRHWDGDPMSNLSTIARAVERVERLRKWDTQFFQDVSAKATADLVISESINHTGAEVRLDDEGPGQLAIWREPLHAKHYGSQSDLEWVYLVSLINDSITVWGGGYGSAAQHRRRGPVDPRSYTAYLRQEYQAEAATRIAASMDFITEQGWTVTPPRRPAKDNSLPLPCSKAS